MRLSEYLDVRSRHIVAATMTCLLVACGGSGGKDPILGTPSVNIAPRVVLTTPAKLIPIASGIAVNTALTAKFSRNMLASSLNNSSFTVECPSGTPISGVVTYDPANRIAVLKHTTNFPDNTTCTATITTAATDIAGVALAKNYVWRFTTSSIIDNDAPTVIANNPVNAATAICLTKSVNVTFSEAMDPTSFSSASFYVTNASAAVMPGALTYDTLSNTATFSIANPPGYTANSVYTSHVTTDVKDLAGKALDAANTVSFTTGAQSCASTDAINLRTIETYGAFGGGAGTTNSGINTIINGDLGTTAACTLFTGFHDASNVYTETTLNIGEVTGDIYCGPPAPGTTQKLALATQAAADARTAFNELAAKTPSITLNSDELGTLTLTPGIYKPAATTLLLSTGDLTLNAAGDADAVWIFQVPASLTIGLIATPRRVLLTNGAQAKNVFWQVGSAARIENGSTMVGTIIASAGVTISTAGQTVQTTLTGRAIGLDASVTMVNTTIVSP
jgi:hypothetical protein